MCWGVGTWAALFTLLASSFVSGDGVARNINLPSRVIVSEAFSHSDTGTTLYSSDNYLKCTSDVHVTPRTTQEVSDLIQLYTSRHRRVKIRATRRGFHSSAGFVCSGRRDSSKKEHRGVGARNGGGDDVVAVTMLLHLMNHVVDVDEERRKVTVEAGMTLLELAHVAEANAMSVPAGAFSMYANLTVGGVVMASAHGSGLGSVSSLGDLVRMVKWVNAKGEVIVSDVGTERGEREVRALVGGLGLLGIATEFTFQLQENSRTMVETRKGLRDVDMVADLKRVLSLETPHVIVHWRPDFGTYKAVLLTQVGDVRGISAATPKFYPNGKRSSDTPIDNRIAGVWSELMATWEEDAAEESDSADMLNADICSLGEAMLSMSLHKDADGTPIDHGMLRTNYAMVSGDCSPKCLYNVHHMGTFTEDTEFTIKFSELEEWVQDVKTVVKTELAEVEARLSKRYGEGKVKRCMPPGYFWLRFGQGNSNLLSTSTGSENVVYVQWTHLHSAMVPNKLSKQSSIAETLEQLTLCKYKGRPHWGKNHERVFRHPNCKVMENFPTTNVVDLLELQLHHDPDKVFEPELFGHLVQKTGPGYSDLCTGHFWCYCEGDSHCPGGYACGDSPSFPEYKICKVIETYQQDAEL
ncbi:hypothetical protein M758_3G212900 [Ceratodon purpureus]|nr:hypothetical protein M758_3G212900 [Ceratodon purpureus]